jgi:hypothetical protein
MRLLQVSLYLALLCLPAAAQDQQTQGVPSEIQSREIQSQDIQSLEQSAQIGRGVLCDTQQQMIRFVALRDDGKEAMTAVQTVNEEAHNKSACNMVMVMFTSRKVLGELTIHGKIVSLVEITVLAFGDGQAWKRVPALTQYTLVPEKGQNV